MAIFAEKSIEVRPDQFVIILWLAGLWISVQASSDRLRFGFFAAGLLLGIAFLFSPKALLPFAALSVTFMGQSYIRESRRHAFPRYLRIQSSYTLGFLIPIVVCLAYFFHLGTLKVMMASTIFDNFTYPDIHRPFYLLELRHICFFLLALTGIVIHLRGFKARSVSVRANELGLLIPTLWLLLVFLFVQRAPYPQSVLLFAPMLAIYAAQAFRKSMDGILTARRDAVGTTDEEFRSLTKVARGLLFLTATMAAGVIIPCAILALKARPFTRTNVAQFERMAYVLNHTRTTDAVFDGESAYIFRPQAYFYGSLFHAIEGRIQRGEIKPGIPESLMATNCRLIIYDERVSTLPQSVQLFLKVRYAPSGFPGVYLAR